MGFIMTVRVGTTSSSLRCTSMPDKREPVLEYPIIVEIMGGGSIPHGTVLTSLFLSEWVVI